MTAFASKVWAGRRHPRWWIVALAAVTAMAFAAGLSARAEAAAVEWTPYSESAQFTDDSCGYPMDVAVTFSGRVGVRAGTGPDAGFFFFTDNYSVREVHTDPATGQWFVVRANGQFKEVKATLVGGNVFEVTAKDSGQRFIMEDSTGKVVLRSAGLVTFRYTVDAGSNTIVDFQGATPAGHVPDTSACSAAGSILGIDSASRLTAHPIGTTASPLGYYEYLPPGYGSGAKQPLLIFLHGFGENGDGTSAQLPNVISNSGIAYYIANNGWAADRPFVVLAPQHNFIESPEFPYPCDVPFGGSCLMQHQHDYGNPLPAGSACWAPSEVRAFLDYALAHYNGTVDPTRVYLTGLSCGGYGVWESLAQFGAGRIAAAVPIAGDGRPALGSSGCALASAPIWAFHGDADDLVNPAGSIDTIAGLRTCPAPPAKELRLTIYPGVDHNSWDHAYSGSQGQDIYGWMLGFTTG
jgi:dienelactone hydrolase